MADHSELDIDNINVGMTIYTRPYEEIKEMLDDGYSFSCGWADEMEEFCGLPVVIDEDRYVAFRRGRNIHVDGCSWWWSLDLFVAEIVSDSPEVYLGNISVDLKESTIEKMIKLVRRDYSKIFALIRISAAMNIDNQVVDKLIRKWAEAKWKHFIWFGKKFYLSTSFEEELNSSSYSEILGQLNEINPIAKRVMENFSLTDIINNKYERENGYFGDNPKFYGSKISGLTANFFAQKTVDWLAVNLFNKNKFTANVVVSIHPADYLTMSVNKSNWQSCHKIGEGCYSNGVIDLMIDDTTLVSYRRSDAEYRYDMNNVTFHWNSKNWRQLVYMDVEKLSFVCSREYPSSNEALSKMVRQIIEEQLVAHFQLPGDKWKIRSNYSDGYHGYGKNYHDVENGYPHKMVYYNRLNHPEFYVGKNIGCIICGSELESGEESTCYECREG